jgi:DNA-binding beta-propeller fold protein YncE
MFKFICVIIFFNSLVSAQPVLTELGRFGGTGSAPGKFKDPTAIDFSEDGRLFVCDRGNQRIQVFDLFGNFRINLGGFGWQEEKFDGPADIWARSTINIYIADYNNQRVQRFDKDLNYINSKRSNPGSEERFQFREVLSVAYSPQGDLFILDAGDKKVIKFNSQDQGDVAFGFYDSGAGELTFPIQVELSSDHRVIVSDAEAEALFVYDHFGNFLYHIKHPEFKYPMGIAHDIDNRIYVADPESKSIFEFTLSGKFLNQYKHASGIPFKEPMDLCVIKMKSQMRFYIVDGDEILITERITRTPEE